MHRGRQVLSQEEARLFSEVIAERARQRELEERATRVPPLARASRWLWVRRAQTVPMLVMAGLLAAGIVIRAYDVHPAAIGSAGAGALAFWWWWRAGGSRNPALAMLRPVLAVLYLVLSAAL